MIGLRGPIISGSIACLIGIHTLLTGPWALMSKDPEELSPALSQKSKISIWSLFFTKRRNEVTEVTPSRWLRLVSAQEPFHFLNPREQSHPPRQHGQGFPWLRYNNQNICWLYSQNRCDQVPWPTPDNDVTVVLWFFKNPVPWASALRIYKRKGLLSVNLVTLHWPYKLSYPKHKSLSQEIDVPMTTACG